MRFMGPSFARSRYDVPGLGGLTMGRESKVSSHPMIRSKRWPFHPFHGDFLNMCLVRRIRSLIKDKTFNTGRTLCLPVGQRGEVCSKGVNKQAYLDPPSY